MENRIKVRLNSSEKIEELLQEIYDQACRQLNEINLEINKLTNSTNLGDDTMTMDSKSKYAKAMHDYIGDKNRAITSKFEIAKFMGEVMKYSGNISDAMNDQSFSKATKLDLSALRNVIKDEVQTTPNSDNYILKK